MKLLSNKLGVYLGILALGGGIGFFGSRQINEPTVIKQAQVYPTAIPTQSNPISKSNSNREINFIATAAQK